MPTHNAANTAGFLLERWENFDSHFTHFNQLSICGTRRIHIFDVVAQTGNKKFGRIWSQKLIASLFIDYHFAVVIAEIASQILHKNVNWCNEVFFSSFNCSI